MMRTLILGTVVLGTLSAPADLRALRIRLKTPK